MAATYRKAPPGFTKAQWEEFNREGYLVIENALTQAEIDYYLNAIDECIADDPNYTAGKFYGPGNVVERHPVFTELIDHPRHVGYAYDIYGELLKLHISQFLIRPHHSSHNAWHPDGARALPYGVFSPKLPMQIKIGYWLTDLPRPKMGNLVVMPRSHHSQYLPEYTKRTSVPGEKVICVPKGTMTIMYCGVWHRVEANESNVVRKNIFLAYCPSWICEADRIQSDPAWLKTLNREQRIIMRSYTYGYDRTKPPKSDFPLFLDRDTGLDSEAGMYPDDVSLNLRKRKVAHEKWETEN
ncbi:MAG: phytanoyl-CoA dioxygenase family protein [Candidatus Poribacteria bacterium]|nr:phytanoyl-CoA dioxygenase family protein [Candidatus Poribacteria bacterium]